MPGNMIWQYNTHHQFALSATAAGTLINILGADTFVANITLNNRVTQKSNYMCSHIWTTSN